MYIEDHETFKTWLMNILGPLCDADPEALAKYIHALVKKDRPTEELRRTMISQLDVFLQEDTRTFVNLLISKLEGTDNSDYKYFIKIKEEPSDTCPGGVINIPIPDLPFTRREEVSSTNVELGQPSPAPSTLNVQNIPCPQDKPNTRAGEQPNTSGIIQPSTNAVVLPSTTSVVHTSTSAVVHPVTSSFVYPNTNTVGFPTSSTVVDPRNTSAVIHPNTSALVHPNNSAVVHPNTSAIVHPNTSAVVHPNTSAIVYQNSNAVVRPNTNAAVRPNTNAVVHPNTNASVHSNTNAIVHTNTNTAVQTNSTAVQADVKPIISVQPTNDQPRQNASPPESSRFQNGSLGSAAPVVIKQEDRQLSVSRLYERKSDSVRDDRKNIFRRRDSLSPPPRRIERSRSRSWERRPVTRRSRSKSRRPRSRGRERDRSRTWRKGSPPFRNRAYDRDRKMRSWSRSPPPRSRSRSPPARFRSRYRNRSPLSRSRSRSLSPYDSPRKSSPLSGGGTPTQDSNNGEGLQNNNNKETQLKKRRCRDFDEKGFCMRGEMCPYDHGKDPVVLEDVGQVLSFSAPGAPGIPPPAVIEPPASSVAMPIMGPMLPPGLGMNQTSGPLMIRPPSQVRPAADLSEYNPDAPSMEPRIWSKQPFRTAGGGSVGGGMRSPAMFGPQQQRELINVPVTEGEDLPFYSPAGNPMKQQCVSELANEMGAMSPHRQRFDYSRLGIRRGNCTLHLKKVPNGLNNIAHLHNHFFKFGKIVNIQVCYDNDPESALITFTTHAEASVAYKSTEAVLNNRFIKVFWFNPDNDKQENVPPLNRMSAKDRLGAPLNSTVTSSSSSQSSNEVEKVFISGANITKTVYIPSAYEKKRQDPMIITTSYSAVHETLAAREYIRRRGDEKKKEALRLTQHLCKRKKELLEKLVLVQKRLIEKLEQGTIPPDSREEVLATIKSFQENIDAIRGDVTTEVKPSTSTVKMSDYVKKTREQTQKQILDAELDLFNQQQEGKDTLELQKRVYELKTKAHNLGFFPNNGVYRYSRGGARYRSIRGRGGFNPHATVDHRPTKLLVSGFESDDKADVLEHFSKFGEVVDHVWDEATPALVIQFKTRKDAETAMAKGRNFQDRLMSVTWFNAAQSMGMRGAGMRSVMLFNENEMLTDHDDEEEALRINLDSNEDLLLQDEEEDEDEDRSWRR